MTFEQISELVELVARRRLRKLELEKAGFKLRIEGLEAEAAPPPAEVSAAQAAATTPPPPPAGEEASPFVAPSAAQAPGEADHVVTSPIVGTFYAAASPDSDAFVRVGDRVTKGQVLCIVEAMKLMNEIESDVDGEVVRVFPKNAQPVEFGEELFAIRSD